MLIYNVDILEMTIKKGEIQMSKFRKRLVDDAGFTLIELLVVIAVLGILAGIAIPRLTGVTNKAKLSEAQSGLGSIKTALEMYDVENDAYPAGQEAFNTMLSGYLDSYNASGSAVGTWEDWTVTYSVSGSSFNVELGQDLDGDGTTQDDEKATLTYSSGEYTTSP